MNKAIFNVALAAFVIMQIVGMITGKPIPIEKFHHFMDILVFMGVVYLVEKY